MIKYKFLSYILVGIGLVLLTSCKADGLRINSSAEERHHPCLILTNESIPQIEKGLNYLPILQASFKEIKEAADIAIDKGIVVPIPKDPGGGYTHEQHKRNYLAMYHAGISYQITQETKYLDFVRAMLLAYAKMYPTLGVHPMQKNQAPGKLFWQGLNESVWLVYSIQAYDCVIESLSEDDRKTIEENLFRKVVEFFTIEDSYSFNRVHNHGTWAAAGVGMTGMVLKDSNYVQMALYGTDKSGNAGYLKQIDELFSPDGFYAEGPYYQRYAIMPFILFAQALDNNWPELEIFNYKDGVLNKAVITLLQLTDESGKFFPLNDAIKAKDYRTPELVFATNIVFNNTRDNSLADIANVHGKVMLSKEGLEVAKALYRREEIPFERKSMLISDGPDGNMGGVGLLRSDIQENNLTALFKATSQGMGHGHFDRLSYLVSENGNEIIQDYGAARFLNVEEKHGGRYLPENNTWAKQTVAHNTLVVNGESNFRGNLENASNHNPAVILADLDSDSQKIMVAVDSHCYAPGVFYRGLVLVDIEESSYLVDIIRFNSDQTNNLDLPLYYKGHLISTNFEYKANTKQIEVVGNEGGYQHLWKIASAENLEGTATITWKNHNRFYSFSTLMDRRGEILLTRIGANDPEFNLRNEPGILVRQKSSGDHSFISVIEAHGSSDPVIESVSGTKSAVKELKLLHQSEDYTITKITLSDGKEIQFALAFNSKPEQKHSLQIDDQTLAWQGVYDIKIKGNNK